MSRQQPERRKMKLCDEHARLLREGELTKQDLLRRAVKCRECQRLMFTDAPVESAACDHEMDGGFC